jgi:DNA-binding beta-propeller fold protein YncE
MKIGAALLGVIAGVSLCSATAANKPSAPYPVLREYQAGDAFWDYAVFDSSAHRIYVGRENGVTTIDLDSGKVNAQFIAGKQVHDIVLLDRNRALATNGGLAKAVIFDRGTGKILAEIPTGTKPDGAALEPATGQIVIMNGISHDVVFADPNSGAVLGNLALDGEPGTPVLDGHGLIFAAISDHSEISVIDAATRKIVKQLALPQCDDAAGLALDGATGVLLVTCANLKAITLDSHTGHILGTATIAKYPDLIAFDPVRHVFYVPCIPGTLFVIGEGKDGAPQIEASVTLASGIHTEALDAEGGLLYLPAGNIIFPKTHGDRPGVEPGTFKVLVVDVKRK